MLVALLTALTIVIGMRLMGALLISSLIIFPSLTSMRVFGSFKAVIATSMVLSVICFVIGIVISYQYNIPAGASIVVVNLAAFIIATSLGASKKIGRLKTK
jgi:zinc transport system permease protein